MQRFIPLLLEISGLRNGIRDRMKIVEKVILSARRRRIISAREYDLIKRRLLSRETLGDVGKRLGVTRERVRKLENMVIEKIDAMLPTSSRTMWTRSNGDATCDAIPPSRRGQEVRARTSTCLFQPKSHGDLVR